MISLSAVIGWFRQAEYTGANRCLPCTVVNVGITAILSLIVAIVFGGQTGLWAAAVVGTAGMALIYLRGYLIPGTPALTKRYLPESVVAYFGKQVTESTPVTEIDVEQVLDRASILEPCQSANDLCLTPSFKQAWQARMDDLSGRTEFDDRVPIFMNDAESAEIDHETLETRQKGAAYTAHVDGQQIAHWESKAAFVADCAAAELLADRVAQWEQFGFSARTEVAGSLRLWLDQCPVCGASVAPGHDTVESCCRAVDVISIQCESCDCRLFEIEYDPSETPETVA